MRDFMDLKLTKEGNLIKATWDSLGACGWFV